MDQNSFFEKTTFGPEHPSKSAVKLAFEAAQAALAEKRKKEESKYKP